MTCTICRTTFYYGSYLEPEEPCMCGEMATDSAWRHDRWRGVVFRARFALSSAVLELSYWLLPKQAK